MDNLAKLRKQAGISQAELADMLGVLQQTISKYENGIREPDNKTLIKLAEILNCSTDYLLGRTYISAPYEERFYINENKPELTELWNDLRKREDLQMLLRQTKDMSSKKVYKIISIIKILEDDHPY